MRFCIVGVFGALVGLVAAAQQQPSPETAAREPRATSIHTVFEIQPRLEPAIREKIAQGREALKSHRDQGQLIAYISTPISPRGGGHTGTNLAISAFVKKQLEARYGPKLWALDPGQFQALQGQQPEPQGGDYLYMWSEILAGKDGLAKDFDMVYFVGPTDARAYFDSQGVTVQANMLAELDRYVEKRAAQDEVFRSEVAAKPESRRAFVRFYGLCAGVAFSKGAHDEWNLFVRVNRKRGVGDQVAMYYDGRTLSPAEMETEIAPGYEVR